MNNDILRASPSLIVVQCTESKSGALLKAWIQKIYPKTTITVTETSRECIRVLDEIGCDLVVIFDESPHYSLEDLTRSIRQFHQTPIAIIAPFTETTVHAMNNGGDILIELPLTQRKLEMYLKSLWRRIRPNTLKENVALRSGDLILNPRVNEIFLKGERKQLGELHFKLLYALARKSGAFIRPYALYKEAWGNDGEVNLVSLRVRIFELRKILNDDATSPHWIEGGLGLGPASLGYRFVGPTPIPIEINPQSD